MLTITNEDNMALMRRCPDKYFDLAIVDPPYGCLKKNTEFKRRGMSDVKWDVTPTDEYFNELFRVSKNVLIWGANYFNLPIPKSVVVWDKQNFSPLYGDAEICFFYGNLKGMRNTGINMGGVKIFVQRSTDLKKIHPTQKPIKLYEWLLNRFANQGDKILDTHLGSGSIAIACHDYGFDLTACELDKEYYDKAMERIKNHTNQVKLF